MLPEPTPENIRSIREAAGLSQEQAAKLVHMSDRFSWSKLERGAHPMEAARWELFLVKTGFHDAYRPVPVTAEA